MKLNELKSILRAHPDSHARLVLPDGDYVPAHFHITEVGHMAKRFIDCGGTVHDTTDTCLLQTWHSNSDLDHRLTAGTFAKILDLGKQVLPHDDLDAEVEYEDCAVTHSRSRARFWRATTSRFSSARSTLTASHARSAASTAAQRKPAANTRWI